MPTEKPLQFHIYLLLAIITIGTIFFALLFPPFDKPDEEVHFYKAVAVSRGVFVCDEFNGQVVNLIPFTTQQFVETQMNKSITTTVGQDANQIKSCSLPFMYYLAPGVVHFISQQLNIGLHTQFYLSRLLNAGIAILLLVVSLRRLPTRFQYISLYVFSLPMTMYQISSYSKDAYHLGLGVFIFNVVLESWVSKKLSARKLLVLGVALILFVLTRPQYAAFLLLLLTVPVAEKIRQKLPSRSVKIAFLIAVASLTLLILGYMIGQNIYLSPHNPNKTLSYYQQIDPKLQMQYIVTHPGQFTFSVLTSTAQYGVFYLKGMIGILGPLNRPLPIILYLSYLIGGLLILFDLSKSKFLTLIPRYAGVLASIIVVTVMNIFLAMYLYGTPVGNQLIYGVQGRYFVMLIPLVFLLFAVLITIINRHVAKLIEKYL